MITPAYWYVSSNLGDNLTPWLLRKMGHTAYYVPIESDQSKFIISGSILSLADGACTVWGAGLGAIDQNVKSSARIHAVRGPLSRMRCYGDCPPIYGDPGLLVPKFYSPRPFTSPGYSHSRQIGLLPHFVDQARVFPVYESHEGIRLINILDSVEAIADAVVGCDLIVSSALHGIILAVAYQVPFLWVRFSDLVIGGDFKFVDFFMSIGVNGDVRPWDLRGPELPGVPEFWKGPILKPPSYDVTAFWEACPI
jgi:hypothetical protein